MSSQFLRDYPNLMAEWDWSRNIGLDPNGILARSSQKVFWKCQKNQVHCWPARIRNRTIERNGCPFCSRRKTLRDSSLGVQFPKLVAELHPSKNPGFDPFTVAPCSNQRIWWQCSRGHEWETTVNHRTRNKTGCKKCLLYEISLVNKDPQLSKEWHAKLNAPLSPAEVPATSQKRVWWQCPNDAGHIWQMSVKYRFATGAGCPDCRKDLPTLAEYSDELRAEWDHAKNTRSFDEVRIGSSVKYWWICSRDPSHRWPASPYHRARLKQGCPFCEKRFEITNSKSLEARFPLIAREWHPTLNKGRYPSQFSYGSAFKAWWQCRKNSAHVWQQQITSRTQRNSRCPFCFGKKVSFEKSLEALFPEVAAEWHPSKNRKLKLNPGDVTPGSGRKIWWLCKRDPEHEWAAQIKNRRIGTRQVLTLDKTDLDSTILDYLVEGQDLTCSVVSSITLSKVKT